MAHLSSFSLSRQFPLAARKGTRYTVQTTRGFGVPHLCLPSRWYTETCWMLAEVKGLRRLDENATTIRDLKGTSRETMIDMVNARKPSGRTLGTTFRP